MSTKSQYEENIVKDVAIVNQTNDVETNPRYTTSTKSPKHDKVNADMSQSQSGNKSGNNGNIDQVREILFGSQLRAQEESMAQLEARLQLEQQKLNQIFNDRLDYIEAFFKEEMHSLKQLITGEIEARSVMEKRVDNAIEQQALALETDIKALGEQMTQADDKLTQTFTESTNALETKLDNNEKAFSNAQDKLQEKLISKLDKSEELLKTSISEQKSTFDIALKHVTEEHTKAQEAIQTQLRTELDTKIQTLVTEQDSKQMEKEQLAQYFQDVASKIRKS